jgi:hypothetical protein
LSLSPVTIIVFVAVAIAVKVSALVGIAVAVLRRSDRSPVYGAWDLEPQAAENMFSADDETRRFPVVSFLLGLANRDMSQIAIVPCGDTVTVRSRDGQAFNFGGPHSGVTRSPQQGWQLTAAWHRRGEAIELESEVIGEGKLVETYRCDGRDLIAEFRVTVPAARLQREVTRRYRKSSG